MCVTARTGWGQLYVAAGPQMSATNGDKKDLEESEVVKLTSDLR